MSYSYISPRRSSMVMSASLPIGCFLLLPCLRYWHLSISATWISPYVLWFPVLCAASSINNLATSSVGAHILLYVSICGEPDKCGTLFLQLSTPFPGTGFFRLLELLGAMLLQLPKRLNAALCLRWCFLPLLTAPRASFFIFIIYFLSYQHVDRPSTGNNLVPPYVEGASRLPIRAPAKHS